MNYILFYTGKTGLPGDRASNIVEENPTRTFRNGNITTEGRSAQRRNN